MTIQDYKAGNPQTQTFTYDALDRLRTAGAAGGTGGTYATGTYTYSATGNILNMPGVGNYIYGPTLSGCALDVNGPKPHAVMTAGSHSFAYDCNGNMTTRTIAGTAYTLSYDPENHMTATVGGGVSASFAYDGDGNRVLATVGGVTTVYLGNYYERDMTAGVPKRYYYAGALRVGVRTGTSTLNFLLGDHLGSTSITANSSGGFVSEVRYLPFGQDRYASGTTPTTYRFTGQRQDAYIKLYLMGSRWYDPAIGRWIQPDITVPQLDNPQALNRYAFVYDNPLRYVDPFGYCGFDANGNIDGFDCDPDWFDQQDIATRLRWIRQFMEQTNSRRWFNNIEGILEAFQQLGIAQPGSWLSLVDAGILHAIQDGYAWSRGDISSSVNSGGDEWKTFFDALHQRGDYRNRPQTSAAEQSALWSRAERAGTAYGVNVLAAGISPTASEQDFLLIGDIYRAVGTTPNGGGAAGAAIGGPIGASGGVAIAALVCAGNPLCVGVGAIAGGGAGSTAGYQAGNWLVDPRSRVFGRSPVYYFAIGVLWD